MDIKKLINFIKNNNIDSLIEYLYTNIPNINNIFDQNDYIIYSDIHPFDILNYYENNKDVLDIIPTLIHNLVLYLSEKVYTKNHLFENNNHYYTNIAKTDVLIKLFILNIIIFNKISNTSDYKFYVGLDFEFNNGIIALCQISLFYNNKTNYIWIINPSNLNKIDKKYLIDYIFINKNVYKILHGSESLDIPYIFNQLLENNKEYIIDFLSNMYDTRFMCEYHNLYHPIINKRCSIYDALLYFKIIDENKDTTLNTLSKKITKKYKFHNGWNIKNLSEEQVLYALYDVLYLKDLFLKMDTDKTIQYGIIYDLTRLVFLERWDNYISNSVGFELNQLNNLQIKINNFKTTLINHFNESIKKNKQIINVLEIGYFKNILLMILKNMFYFNFMNDGDIIKNNSLNKGFIFEYLDKLNYNKLLEYLKMIEYKIK